MRTRLIRGVVLLVLLPALAVSCGSDTDPPGAAPDVTMEPSATPAPEETGTGAPAPEGTGPEAPAPGGGGRPYIDTAGAPVGDDGENPVGDGVVCQGVAWLGGQDGANLGVGIAFQVTRVDVTGAALATASCDGPPCVGFTFTDDGDRCQQAVRQGPSEGAIAVYGQVRCDAPKQACDDFRSRLTRQPIEISAAEPIETPGETLSETPGTTETSEGTE
ncbi:hypothetical protein J2S43_003169 [Catenuloplanes nepalensis]|uniref:Uncharacterized protein n=1 Tax=Catenuloplanes nepalensis TaxID=587533 RepID=A0ABT9MTA2_9ACTN|nr:hypothetical protein [Catenuloplanes nepalensis]MDP9794657.1 hypothetical protein [Catenuloplanes nepalensis]